MILSQFFCRIKKIAEVDSSVSLDKMDPNATSVQNVSSVGNGSPDFDNGLTDNNDDDTIIVSPLDGRRSGGQTNFGFDEDRESFDHFRVRPRSYVSSGNPIRRPDSTTISDVSEDEESVNVNEKSSKFKF